MDDVTALLFAIVVLCLFSGLILSFFKLTVAQARRIYWRCAALGVLAAFLCGYPGMARGIEAAVFTAVGMVFLALRATPYFKIGGKIYAFSAADRRAKDDDFPTTFGQDLAHAADMLQRRLGDSDVPDTTGRNITEALDALHRSLGSEDTSETTERSISETVSPPPQPPPRTYVRVDVPGRSGIPQRLTHFLVGLPVMVGGALMTFNPAPPLHRNPHAVSAIGIFCIAGGIYLVVKTLRARAPAPEGTETLTTAAARPHRHAAATTLRESARLAASFAAAGVMGGGLLWWGVSAKLLPIVGTSIVIVGPTLVILAVIVVAKLRTTYRTSPDDKRPDTA